MNDTEWKQSIEQSLRDLHARTEHTSRQVGDILNAWETVKDGFRALESIARVARVLSWIGGAVMALYVFLTHWGHRS